MNFTEKEFEDLILKSIETQWEKWESRKDPDFFLNLYSLYNKELDITVDTCGPYSCGIYGGKHPIARQPSLYVSMWHRIGEFKDALRRTTRRLLDSKEACEQKQKIIKKIEEKEAK